MRIRGLQMCVETLNFDAEESVNILYLTTGLYGYYRSWKGQGKRLQNRA